LISRKRLNDCVSRASGEDGKQQFPINIIYIHSVRGETTKTYLSVKSGRHVALLAEADEGHFDGQRKVRFGTVLRTDNGYVGQARGGSQVALFGCVGV